MRTSREQRQALPLYNIYIGGAGDAEEMNWSRSATSNSDTRVSCCPLYAAPISDREPAIQ